MTALMWDEVGERVFQTGVDRGVLYISDDPGVAWNGLVSVEESPNREIKAFHLDGIKFLDAHILGEFQGKLSAFTYPEEFEQVLGIVPDDNGLFLYDQPPISFGLTYRTLLGDDVSATDRGYRIHILYNLMANPDTQTYQTLGDTVTPSTFSWGLTGTPIIIPGYRPTMHVSIDSTRIDLESLTSLEETLYGTETTVPTLPTLVELLALSAELDTITITDNGDGTWTATGPPNLVEMIGEDVFQIEEVDAVYLDEDTYEVSTTDLDD